MIGNQPATNAAFCFPTKLTANKILVLAIGLADFRTIRINDSNVTVTLAICTCDTQSERVLHNWNVHRALNAHQVTIAISCVSKAAELIEIRANIGNVQSTRGGVAAKQCSLWPTQNLDAFHINEFGKRYARTRLVCPINEDTDGAFKPDIV